ncbi:MAG: PepSY-associated TM helix domain-containing protein [Pseudomonadota bacterium]
MSDQPADNSDAEHIETGGLHGAFRQSMAWLHTWSGIVLSIILYFIFVTGTAGYFNYEIDHWMTPEMPGALPAASTDEMVEMGLTYLRRETPDATRHFVSMPIDRGDRTVRVFANLKEPNEDGERFINTYLDLRTGEPIEVRDTGGGMALYRMHWALHYLPNSAATYIVGIATLFMFLAIITGIVTHKKIFIDFFTLRLGKGQRSWLDGHNISSVLALPFMIMITYSGLVFYDLEYSPGTMFLTMGVEQDAIDEYYQHLRPGLEFPEATGKEAPIIDPALVIAQARTTWPEAQIRFIDIFNPGDEAAMMRVGRTTDGINRGGSILQFSAVTGEAFPEPPPMPANSVFADATLALHEGRFANYWLRWGYFLSGVLGCAMIATGMLLWAKKRRTRTKKNTPAAASVVFVERTNVAIIVGLLLGVAAYFWANRLLPVDLADRAAWEMHCLFGVWALSFLHAGLREVRRAWREQVGLLAGLCLLLPIVNALTTNTHLVASIQSGDWVRAGFDLTMLTFGLILIVIWRRLLPPEKRHVEAPISMQASHEAGV